MTGDEALPRLYTTDELAAYLGCKRHWIDRRVARWPHMKVANENRFTTEHVAAILRLLEGDSTERTARDAAAAGGRVTRGSKRGAA